MKVYLDDERTTPEGWIRVYTAAQAQAALSTRLISHISLDNDLGDKQPEGHTVLTWLEEQVFNDPTFPVPIITIHSANMARVPSMQQAAAKLELIRQQQIQESI